MSPPNDGSARGREHETLAHRTVLTLLASLLIAISIWCLALLYRSWELRQDLRIHDAWIDDLREARRELERPPAELMARARWPFLDALRRSAAQRGAEEAASPALDRAVARLASGLESLREALLAPETPTLEAARDLETLDPVTLERVADASFAVTKAVTATEEQVQARVETIYRRLDDHWRALNALVAVCLLLCASNLGLLHLAHRRRGQLESARDKALRLASHDVLTGLWNREAILRMLRRELARAKRLGLPLGVVLANIDRFREVNGLLGQEHADVVLQEIGWRLGSMVRPYDTLGRFGGDEFLIVLPTCDAAATAHVAQRLRRAIESQEVDYGLGRLRVTLSLAHTTIERALKATEGRPLEPDPDLLIHRLQEALAERGAFDPDETGGIAESRVIEVAPPPDSAAASES